MVEIIVFYLIVGMEEVARHLSFIKNMLVQHSIILNSLQNHAQLTNTGSLVPPPDLPDFPIKTFESFTEFEKMIDESEAVRTYLVSNTMVDTTALVPELIYYNTQHSICC